MDTWSQQNQRVAADDNNTGDFFTDQHGRSWHAEVEISTGHPCSPLTPDGWTAPLDVPRNYISILRGKRTRGAQRETYDLRIEYDRWITDWMESGKRWDADAMKKAIELKVPAAERRAGQFPSEVLLAVGPRPGAKIEAVRAASQGHPYVLGLRPFDPTKASDVKLRDLLSPKTTTEGTDWLDEESVGAPKKRGRPTNAEREARMAATAAEE